MGYHRLGAGNGEEATVGHPSGPPLEKQIRARKKALGMTKIPKMAQVKIDYY
jgi:hypothetical protein